MSKPIGMCGTFDLANFGDLLFPYLAQSELGRRISGVKIRPYSYRQMREPSWPYAVESVEALPTEVDDLAAMLVGGGQLVRFDPKVAPGYVPPASDIPHPTGYWLSPVVAAALAGLPVAFNAVGVASTLPPWGEKLLSAVAPAVQYTAVRDTASAKRLEGLGFGSVRVVPDTAFAVGRILDRHSAAQADELLASVGVDGPFALVQPSAHLKPFAEEVRAVCGELVAEGISLLQVPISPALNDSLDMLDLADLPVKSVIEWPSPPVLANLIQKAMTAVGYSYHLTIVALTGGVPVWRPRPAQGTKYEGLLGSEGLHWLDEVDVNKGTVPLPVARGAVSSVVIEHLSVIDRHWDDIAELVQGGTEETRRSQKARSLRLVFTLPGATSTIGDRLAQREAESATDKRRARREREQAQAREAEWQAREAEWQRRAAKREHDLPDAHKQLQESNARLKAVSERYERVIARKSVRLALRSTNALGAVLKRLPRRAPRKPGRLWRQGRELYESIEPSLPLSVSTRIRKGRAALASRRPTSRAQPKPSFNTFEEYLRQAATQPLIEAPFSEQELRVLGVMDVRKRALAAKYARSNEQPLVSVIMATHNRADCLPAAVESALKQTYKNIEVLVIDDGSTDETAAYLASTVDGRLRVLTTPQNEGVAPARNRGLAASAGQYICYLDSDNIWDAEFVQIMLGELRERSGLVRLAYSAQEICKAAKPGGALQTQSVRFGPFNRSLLENRNYVDLNALMHERSLYEEGGGFDEGLLRLVDWELLLRYTELTGVAAVPCVLSYYQFGITNDQLTLTLPMGPATRALDRTLQRDVIDMATKPQGTSSQPFALRSPARCRYNRPVTVVIPSYEALPYLQECHASVKRYTDGRDVRVIIVDNGSHERVRAYLEGVSGSDATTVICNDANYGFTHAANQGIEQAGPDSDIVLLNNDALVTPGWLAGLQEVFDRVREVGLAVPRQTLFPHTPTMQTHVPFCKLDREIDVTLSAHHGNVIDPFLDVQRGFYALSFAPFFAVYLPRETISEVGLLDVEAGPHYRSDRVYCDLVRSFYGKNIVYTPHSKLYHFLQRSTEELRISAPSLYRELYVSNDWDGILRQQGVARPPARSPASYMGKGQLRGGE